MVCACWCADTFHADYGDPACRKSHTKSRREFSHSKQLDEREGNEDLSLPITWRESVSSTASMACSSQFWIQQRRLMPRTRGRGPPVTTSQRDSQRTDRLQTYRYTFALECDRQYVGRNGRRSRGRWRISVTTVCQPLPSKQESKPPARFCDNTVTTSSTPSEPCS